MFGTIRKHQTWLWAIIITLTIISFVIFFSPYSKLSDARRGPARLGSINGERISEDDFARAQREVYLRYFFMTGNWPDEESKKMGFDPMRETYQWLLLVQKQEQYDIHIGSDVVAQAAREMIRPLERANVNSPTMFVTQILRPRGFAVDDFERFVRHYLGVQELIAAVGLGGKMVTPQEAAGLYEREHQELATEVVFFNASNYLASVSVVPEAIAQYYSNNLANYRIPERVQVSYVKFGVSNFLAQAETDLKTNLTDIVDANLQRLGTNYTRVAKTPEEAKAKIREEILHERAIALARRRANEFDRPILETEPVRLGIFAEAAQTNGLTVSVSAPFTLEEGPKDLDAGPDFARAAFALTPDQPFTQPQVGRDGVYVIAYNRTLPSEIPALEKIHDQVLADFKHSQGISLARQAGQAFSLTVTNGLAQGKSFADLCKEAKLDPITLPPFSLSTRTLPELQDRVSLNQLKQLAFTASPGKASPFQLTSEGGVIVFVKARLPLDPAKMKADLPGFAAYVRQSRQNEAFNEWFRHEAERGLRDTPLLQQQPPPPKLGSRAAKS